MSQVMLYIPGSELQERVRRLQALMGEKGVAGALLVQRADLYYFSGTAQNAHLFIPCRGGPVLLVRRSLSRARQESRLSQITAFAGWTQLAATVKDLLPPGAPAATIGMELDVLPANHYFRYRDLLSPLTITDISQLVRRVRAVKSPYEIEQLKLAAAMGKSLFNFAREIIRSGMTEIELAGKLEGFARCQGHQGAVRMRGFNQEIFYGHVMSGENAAVTSFFDGPTGGPGISPSYPQGAGTRIIKEHEPILIDFVSIYNGYIIDQTRIFCLGALPPPLERAYQTALHIKKELTALGQAGTSSLALYTKAVEIAREAGLADYFMGCEEKVIFVGHGVGLELDELPVIAKGVDIPLEEGMVFALEPKFIFPGQGVVGVEDTFVVRSCGLEQLTLSDDALQIVT